MLVERDLTLRDETPGWRAAERLAATADAAIAELAERSSAILRRRWAVVALGGYGAGRLLPGSDLDLLVLSEEPSGAVKPFAQALLYPLWDSGVQVGHQTRTPKENLRAADQDIATLTSLLTARPLAGDADLAEESLAAVAARARQRAARVLPEIRRRDRPGSPYMLEPDLKEGAGGQRDIDELVWTAAVLTGIPSAGFGPLLRLGVIDTGEAARLREAAARLTEARWVLGLAHPRSGSVLEAHAAQDPSIDSEALQAAIADVHHILHLVRERTPAPSRRAAPPPRDPPASEGWGADRLFGELRLGTSALDRLEQAAWSGALDALVPGLREAMNWRRPGLGHRLTVGAHCLEAAACVLEPSADERLPFSAACAPRDPRPLLAATLVHDFGKRERGAGHPLRSAETARRVARRLGLSASQAAYAGRLVREHLLLAETAFSTDFADRRVLEAVAARVGDPETLGSLYLLTRADSLATSPGAWSDWHSALVGELVGRLEAALATVSDLSADAAPPSVFRRDITGIEHLAEEVLEAGARAFRYEVSPGPLGGTWRVSIAAFDRPGLFARLSGVLALCGLDILDADAHAFRDVVALDSFTVRSATLAPVGPSTWAGLDRHLTAAIEGRLALEVRLAERRRQYPRTARAIVPHVRVDVSTEGITPVRVEAADRVGLLHDLALAITEAGLDIRSATVVTQDGVARDTFMVTDADGRPLRDRHVVSALAERLRAAAG